jgi:hypothetical protein
MTVGVKVGLPIASQQTEQESTFPVAVIGQPPKLARKEEDIPEFLTNLHGT